MIDYAVILFVLGAHYIGDSAFQSQWVADNKGKYWYVMFVHCMIWSVSICAVLYYFNILTFWKFIFLIAGHWAMDAWKSRQPRTPENWWKIYPDQAWHLFQCVLVAVI